MSSPEFKKLKTVLSRSRVKLIKKKYQKAINKVYKKTIEIDNYKEEEMFTSCNFTEFRKNYFGAMYVKINDLVDSYIDGIEIGLTKYIYERYRNKAFEVIILIKNIFNKKHIIWAVLSDYLECKEKCLCPEDICFIVCEDQFNDASNILNFIGEKISENVYIINDVEIHLSGGYVINSKKINLKNEEIKEYIIDGEKILILDLYRY